MNLLPRLASASARHAWPVFAAGLLLAALCAWLAVTRLGVTTDTDTLFDRNLPWKQREYELRRLFPQNTDLLVAVVSGDTPEAAEAVAVAVAVAVVVGLVVEKRLALMPLLVGGFALVFGLLTLLTGDGLWVKVKVTALNGGLAVALAEAMDLEAAVEFASAVAAASVMVAGAQSSMPERSRVAALRLGLKHL